MRGVPGHAVRVHECGTARVSKGREAGEAAAARLGSAMATEADGIGREWMAAEELEGEKEQGRRPEWT